MAPDLADDVVDGGRGVEGRGQAEEHDRRDDVRECARPGGLHTPVTPQHSSNRLFSLNREREGVTMVWLLRVSELG